MMLRKITAFILGMVLLLISFTHEIQGAEIKEEVAFENNTKQREILLEKAIEAFPEYEKELRGQNAINAAKMRNGGMGNIVINETRRLSDTEIVSYTQYDSGIATAAIGLQTAKNIIYTINGTRYTEYKMNIWLICGASTSILFVEDVIFCLNLTDFDEIYSKGNTDTSLCTAIGVVLQEYVKKETVSDAAKLQYSGYFEFEIYVNGGYITQLVWANLILEVRNNTYTLSNSY